MNEKNVDNEVVPLPKKAPYWFKVLVGVILIGAGIGFWNVLFKESVLDVVEDQLQTIHENKITEAYYNYMSQDFQRTTTLNSFREFIRSNPILSSYSSFLYQKRVIENKTAIIEGILIGADEKNLPIEFKLIKEESGWKILSININDSDPTEKLTSPPSVFKTPDIPGPLGALDKELSIEYLLNPVKEQFAALANEDLIKAYELTSNVFKEAATFADFSSFIFALPMFTEQIRVIVKEGKIHQGIGKLELEMHDHLDHKATAEYTLGQDNGKWKIWGVQMLEFPEKTVGRNEFEESAFDTLEISQIEFTSLPEKR